MLSLSIPRTYTTFSVSFLLSLSISIYLSSSICLPFELPIFWLYLKKKKKNFLFVLYPTPKNKKTKKITNHFRVSNFSSSSLLCFWTLPLLCCVYFLKNCLLEQQCQIADALLRVFWNARITCVCLSVFRYLFCDVHENENCIEIKVLTNCNILCSLFFFHFVQPSNQPTNQPTNNNYNNNQKQHQLRTTTI